MSEYEYPDEPEPAKPEHPAPPARRTTPGAATVAEPQDYVTLGVCLYVSDLLAADEAVRRCRAAGLRTMTRSRLIRIALARLDVDSLLREECQREDGRVR